MKLEFGMFSSLCHPSTFILNDIKADWTDFGEQFDRDPDNAEDYCCKDMRFTRIDATPDVLLKYRITTDEYNEICEMLEDEMSWGECGWCS